MKLPDNNWIKYEFDGEDRIRKVIDQRGKVSETIYDDGGRVEYLKAADGATVRYEYDKCGNIKKETNPMGATVEKTYDKIGNVLTVKDSEGKEVHHKDTILSSQLMIYESILSIALDRDALDQYSDGSYSIEISTRVGTGEKVVAYTGTLVA